RLPQDFFNLFIEVVLVRAIDLRGNLERQPGAARDFDGAIDALLRRNPSQERQVAFRRVIQAEQVVRQAVVHGPLPVGLRQSQALIVGNRYDRLVAIDVIQRLELRNIETAVQRREMREMMPLRQRKMQVVDMEMDDVELVEPLEDLLEQPEMRRDRVDGA